MGFDPTINWTLIVLFVVVMCSTLDYATTFTFQRSKNTTGNTDLAGHIIADAELDTRKSPLLHHPQITREQIEKIKQNILNELGLKSIPDNRKVNVSQEEYTHIFQQYVHGEETRRLQRLADDVSWSQKLLKFISLESSTHRSNKLTDVSFDCHQLELVTFPLNFFRNGTFVMSDLDIRDATVRVLIPGLQNNSIQRDDESSDDRISTFILYQYDENQTETVLDRRVVFQSAKDPRWVDFNVAHHLDSLLNSNNFSSNLSVYVKCDKCDKRVRAIDANLNVLYEIETSSKQLLSNSSSSLVRAKRSRDTKKRNKKLGRTQCFNNNKRCCRHPMVVVFKELESFDFIIEPKSYDAGFCKGRCPFRYNPAHKHALIQSLIWRKNRLAPKPCCAPSRLDALQIIHYGENNKMIISNWTKMSVVDCACS